jgi:hypothetical protein
MAFRHITLFAVVTHLDIGQFGIHCYPGTAFASQGSFISSSDHLFFPGFNYSGAG